MEEQTTNQEQKPQFQAPPKKQSGIGKKVLLVLLVLILAAGAGFAGYTYAKNQAQKETDAKVATLEEQLSEFRQQAAKAETIGRFSSSELGVSFKYPEKWGVASVKKGEAVSPGQGNYQQITFSKQPKIDINFVFGPFVSPLDGCPSPSTIAPHEEAAYRASIIGWSGDKVKRLLGYPGDTAVVQLEGETGDRTNWTIINKNQNVLVFRNKDLAPHKAVSKEEAICDPVTQAEADAANAHYQYTRFALNYANKTVKGVNAQLSTKDGVDQALQNELQTVILSIKDS